MQALTMKRKNLQRLEQRVRDGLCLAEGCEEKCVSRGLCDAHRQEWYTDLRSYDTEEKRMQFEENSIREGLILASGEQRKWRRKSTFAAARVS